MRPKVVAVVGPTASGKTKMAIELAHELNGEIISADSRLVYKGFDIAAAKPTIEEREGIPHYMMDIVEPEFDYSVGNYYDEAKKIIFDIISRGKMPIVAGGTGLYIRILLEHYNLPRVEANYELRSELEEKDKEELLKELEELDGKTYERMRDANKRRIVRAIEVIRTLNKPISQIELEKEPEFEVDWRMPVLTSRQDLYDKINRRVDVMIENGLVEETQYLLKKHGRIKNFVDTIGYREILSYLDGEYSLEDAAEKLKQHTRNYAKRQLTWFRQNPKLQINI